MSAAPTDASAADVGTRAGEASPGVAGGSVRAAAAAGGSVPAMRYASSHSRYATSLRNGATPCVVTKHYWLAWLQRQGLF
eukprot:288978-Chlamydomonas_euryale.AAC.1